MIISQLPLNHLLNHLVLDFVYLVPVPHLNFEPRRFFAILPHRIRIHQNYQVSRLLDLQRLLFVYLALARLLQRRLFVHLALARLLDLKSRHFFDLTAHHQIQIHQNYQALRPLDRQCVLFGCLALVLPLR